MSDNLTPDYYVDKTTGDDSSNGTSDNSPFKTISQAISAATTAGSNKVIKIADGTYAENLVITGNITLIGNNSSPGNVIINPSTANGTAISIDANDVSLTVDGITLKTAAEELSNPIQDTELKGRGCGLSTGSYKSTITLSNVVIDGFTYGISSYGETTLTLTDSTIQNTTYKGVYAKKLASADFTNVEFKNNAIATTLLPSSDSNSRSGSAIDFNLINDCDHISFTGCTFDTNGDTKGSTSGAIKIKIRGGDDEKEGSSYTSAGSITKGVSVSNCTFINNSRDVVLGTQQKPNSSDDFLVSYSGGSPIREYNFAVYDSSATDGIASSFFANGNAVTIETDADGTSTKISWRYESKDCSYKYSSDNAKKLLVFGGSRNNTTAVTSSNITMNGGEVLYLIGGSYFALDNPSANINNIPTSASRAEVISSTITMTGGKADSVFGGGMGYTSVGNSTINVSGSSTAVYVNGGGFNSHISGFNSNNKPIYSDYGLKDPNATNLKDKFYNILTGTADVTISDEAKVSYALGGGRLGCTYVESTNLTINGGTFDEIVAGGMNGYTGTANLIIEAKDGKSIVSGLIASGNRGQVADVTVDLKSLGTNGSATNVAIGALTWKTSTDGGPNAIFDKITFNIAENISRISNIYLGGSVWTGTNNKPTYNPWADGRNNSLSDANIIINAPGYKIKVADVGNEGQTAVKEYTINAGKIWTINGASISDISKITCMDSGKLILKNNSDFVPAPLVDKNTGKINLSTYNVTVEKTKDNTTIFIDAKNVPEHINGAGTSGYWVGVGLKAPTNADFNAAKLITGWGNTFPLNLDWTSASAFDSHFGGEDDLDYFTTYYDFGSSNNTSDVAYLLVNWDGNGTDYETYLIDFSKVTKKSSSTGGGGITVPPTDDPKPEPITPDENNNVTVPPIDEKKADELIHEAVSSGSDSVSIIGTSDVKGEYTEVTVSKSDLETVSKKIENNNNINSVSIETSEGDIILEKEVLNSILETTDADSVSFEIEDAKDKLTDEQKEAVGDRPVYDINIKAGNENITSFNGKTITISLPYTLKAGEDPENIVVYYVKEDGSLEKVNCTYKDGKVIFETDHLSKYVIGYEESEPVTPDTPDDKKDDNNNNTIYYAVAAVIVILIIIALAYYFMKKKQ